MLNRDPLARPEDLIRRVYAYVAYRVGDGADAEDITSATFELAIRHRSSYEASRGEPAAWLVGIARRQVASFWAARRLEREVPEQAEPGDLAEETVTRLAVGDAVRRLSDRDQELIALRYGADLSTRDIARVLELDRNAVDVALHRARGRLAETLERELGRDQARTGSARKKTTSSRGTGINTARKSREETNP